MRRSRGPEALLGALLLLVGSPTGAQDAAPADAASSDAAPAAEAQADKPELALFGTIPIYWGEGNGMEDVLAGTATSHWARALLDQGHSLRPLATLLPNELAGHDALLIAQPRVLSPAENVALDGWVRGGGRLLLFVDPLLSGESRYPLGDSRRPQDVVLLSPLLRHWGLDLQFAADQSHDQEVREFAGMLLPHRLSGTLAALPDNTGCEIQGAGILGDCRIGAGRVVIVADADLLDLYHPAAGAEEAMLALIRRSFGPAGIALQNSDLAEGAHAQAVDKAVHNDP